MDRSPDGITSQDMYVGFVRMGRAGGGRDWDGSVGCLVLLPELMLLSNILYYIIYYIYTCMHPHTHTRTHKHTHKNTKGKHGSTRHAVAFFKN